MKTVLITLAAVLFIIAVYRAGRAKGIEEAAEAFAIIAVQDAQETLAEIRSDETFIDGQRRSGSEGMQ